MMRALLLLSVMSAVTAAHYQKLQKAINVQIDGGGRYRPVNPSAVVAADPNVVSAEAVNPSAAVVQQPPASAAGGNVPPQQPPQQDKPAVPQVFDAADVFIFDYEEALTATSLWQYLGGVYGKDPNSVKTYKAPVKAGKAAAIAEKLGKDEEYVQQYVNPYPWYWGGKTKEDEARAFQLAALEFADLEDFERYVWGGKERIAKIAEMLKAIGKEHIYCLSNAYKEVMLGGLKKVGLADLILDSQMIGRETGPYAKKVFQEANSEADTKIDLTKDENARKHFVEVGLPDGPEGDKTAIALDKWPVIRKMRRDGLLKENQKALFVDDNTGHIEKLIAANSRETTPLAGAWLVVGRQDPVCNPENKPQKGGLAEQELAALAKCHAIPPSPGGAVVPAAECTRAVCPSEPCPAVEAPLARVTPPVPGSGAAAAALLLYLAL